MRKIIILSSIVLVCSWQASAQITESSYIVGGSSSFSLATDNEGNSSASSLSIRPEFAKFVSEKWLIGGGLGYSIGRTLNINGSAETRSLIQGSSGFFGATRFYSLTDKFYFTLEYSLGLSYSSNSFKTVSDFGVTNNSTTSGAAGVGVSPGLAYFFNEKWMIFSRMGSLSYSYDHNFKTEVGLHRLGYSFQANSFGIGVRYVLGTGK